MNKATLAKATRKINKIGVHNIRYLTIKDSDHCADYYDIYAVTNDNQEEEVLSGLNDKDIDDYKDELDELI